MTRGGLLLLLVVAVLLLGTLGVRPLYKADESRYAEIPREMVASGDWLTPRLNGLKYFEKPPLQYWATAAFFSVFGERDWAARLWTALAGIAGIVLVFQAGRRLFSPQAGALAAALLAGSPLYVLLCQINTLDMGLTFFLSAAMLAFALQRYYLFWAACAAAVLTKGLIGIVLPLGTIGLYVLLKRDFRLVPRIKPVSGLLLFLAISAPWFVAVSAANPEFFHFFFIQEHFQRFTTKMHGRYQPFWYFVPILAFGIAPWLLPLISSLKGILVKKDPAAAFDAPLLLGLWIAVVFLFFSASSSKLPSYILPVLPALALLLGRSLAEAQPRGVLAAQAVLGTGAGVLLAAYGFFFMGSAYGPWLGSAGFLLAAASVAGIVPALAGRASLAVALLALGSFGCTLVALEGHRSLSAQYSIADQVAALGERAPPPGARVFAVDFYDHTLPWYFRRTVTMVGYKDELAEPIRWEPEKFIPDLAGFARAWREAPGAYAVFSSAAFEELKKQSDLPMEVVSRGPRYTIVRKP